MQIKKMLDQELNPAPLAHAPGEEDLRLINQFTRKELSAEEVYVFQTVLCDNEVDRDGERFSVKALEALAKLFAGKTGLFDHSMKSGDQVMRVYDTSLRSHADRRTSAGEPYAQLMAKVYLLRGEATAELIRQIDAGIKKEVSVSCAVKVKRCSVCGKSFGRQGCAHVKGRSYEGFPCHVVLEEPTDAYEFSFVAVPAQPGAGVVKQFNSQFAEAEGGEELLSEIRKQLQTQEALKLDESAVKALRAEWDTLERLAEDGKAYRAELLAKTARAALLAVPGLPAELLDALCAQLSVKQLEQLANTLEVQAGKAMPLRPQLCGEAAKQEDENNGYKF
ncbi:MAG: hypothetical protein FWH26_09580 [Oscillospiraceae bacterium]|nr:hypothetical protein [Oscillospiraceae bacterium]